MGLKTINYKIEELGITLPEAYAIVRDLYITENKCTAVFSIQNAPRDKALNLKPIEVKRISFEIEDRNENPYKTAYKKAKEMKYTYTYNSEKGEEISIENPMPFYGWEDDIVAE